MKILSGSVLIVEDNSLNRVLAKKMVEVMGLSVVEADNGKLALELLSIEKFDLVLLDIKMKGMDGVEVLETINTDDRLKDLPVIMISAIDDLRTITRCLKIGAADYLPKPFDMDLVQSRVYRTLKHRRNGLDKLFPKANATHPRILVVDDEPLNLQLIEHCLAGTGYDATSTKNPTEVLAMLGKEAFDMVLLDIKMPEMDGVAVLDAIKKDADNKALPVLMLSALDDFKTIRKCMEKGAMDYISKPFEKVLLLSRIESCLGIA
jgi:CheY-like chemotaxis protein